MSQPLFVGTRKGLFTLQPKATGWDITETSFIGDPVTMVLRDPRDGAIYAALNLGHFGVKLHRSDDAGKSWEECGVPAYPKAEGEEKGASLVQIWSLEPGADGELWAGTIPGGLFRSRDRGMTWELIRSLWDRPERDKWVGGGYDAAGIHSVIVDPRDTSRVSVGVSVGGFWKSADGGASWDLAGAGMYAEYMPPDLREDKGMQDPHRVVASPTHPDVLWCQHHNAAFRSTDAGATFTEVHPQPSKFGFAVAVHPKDPDTAWFIPAVKDECRIPVDGKMVVSRTRDGGASFQTLRDGLPQEHAYDLVFRHALDVDTTGDRLAMGSTTGALWGTLNGGDSWTLLNGHLPPVYVVRFG